MSARTWLKMSVVGAVICVGGPALVWYVTPTEEEIFKRYNPDLQRRSLANRELKQQNYNHFLGKLQEYSKSNKPIWEAAAEDEAATRARTLQSQQSANDAEKARAAEIRKEAMSGK